jgi:hypothetical protein
MISGTPVCGAPVASFEPCRVAMVLPGSLLVTREPGGIQAHEERRDPGQQPERFGEGFGTPSGG